MNSTFTVTDGAQATLRTYTVPEDGWMTTSRLIELPTQLIVVDTPLLSGSANEVLTSPEIALSAGAPTWRRDRRRLPLFSRWHGVARSGTRTYAKDLGKPVSRVYISHSHPDHFAGAGLVGAPLYALPSVAAINNDGGAILRGALVFTGDGGIEPGGLPRTGHDVAGGEETIDSARVSFEPVSHAESSEQLTIGFPGDGILIAQDLLYHAVHAFLGEQHFDGWLAAITAREARPYTTILPSHGLPGDHSLYADARACVTAARAAVAAAEGPPEQHSAQHGPEQRQRRPERRRQRERLRPEEEIDRPHQAQPVAFVHPVIAGYDGSASARNALAYAAGMARRLDRPLLVVYVTSPGVCCEPPTGQVMGLAWETDSLERWLLTELDQVTDPGELEVHVRTRRGSPARELATAASEFNADALVIGAPRHFWHHVAGSVPGWLARHATCPVIVVP